MTVGDLSRKLHIGAGQVLRATRALNINAKDPTFSLSLTDEKAVRDWLAARRMSDAVAAPATVAVAPETPLAALQSLSHAGVRTTRDAPRAESSVDLIYHLGFFQWLEAGDTPLCLRRRADLVLKQFVALGHPTIVRAVAGAGKGWRRTPLGGNGGKHFYLWWAPAGAIPVEGRALTGRQILLRAVRHHDATDVGIDAGMAADWLPATVGDVAETPEALAYPTDEQWRIARDGSPVRVIQGHPGAGKTTALHLAADYAVGERALSIVFSRRLRDETERRFRALGPHGLAIDVLTLEELLAEFEPAAVPQAMASPEESAAAMETALHGHYQRLDIWEGHAPELYAELHAHFVGGAIPVPFRGAKPTTAPTLAAAAYVAARKAALGEPAARAAAAVGEHLAKLGLVPKLFPGPSRARAALDGLLGGSPPPPRLSRIQWIFVDEVQDLTLVEALLVIELCRRNAVEQGRIPGLVVAGDEGQTVRPTDFEWGPFNELINERLGSKTETILPGNVRSPRNIAAVVNNSWDLYRRLSRSERPRGHATADVDDTTAGQVIHCFVRTDEERRQLFEVFKATPGAALIYPGFRVPDEYGDGEGEVWSSASAKGLDFQIVGVLDAGPQLVAMKRLAAAIDDEGRISTIWARTLADQFRVAISRATDTLVFIDEGNDAQETQEVRALCEVGSGEPVEGFLEQEVAELMAHLEGEGGDAQARVTDLLTEAGKYLQDRPEHALRRARQAAGYLGDLKSPGAVTDAATRKEVARLRGVAALLVAVGGKERAKSDTNVIRESNTWLRKAELGDAARAANRLHSLAEAFHPNGRPAHFEARELLESLPVLDREVPEISATVRLSIVAWCKRVIEATLPETPSDRKKLDETVSAAVATYGARHPELSSLSERLRGRIARALLGDGLPKPALEMFERLQERDFDSEGRCCELSGDLAEASRRYERAGNLAEALRSARSVPDLARATDLARTLAAADLPTLEWLADVRRVLGSRPVADATAALTAAEHTALARDVESALAAARPKPAPLETGASAGGRPRVGRVHGGK